MYKHLYKLQEIKQPRRLTNDETRMHKLKQHMLGFMEYLG